MNKPILAFSAALALALVIGCGGGGGGGSSSGSTSASAGSTNATAGTSAGSTDATAGTSAGSTNATAGTSSGSTGTQYVPVQSGLATLTPTKIFNYSLTGTYTLNGVTTPIAVPSLRLEEINPGGSASSVLLGTIDSLTFPSGGPSSTSFTFNAFVSQDSSSNVLLQSVSLNSVNKTVTTPASIIPGNFTTGTTITKTLPYNEGGQAVSSFVVQGTENVAVPYGNYVAYKVTASVDYGSGYVRSGTYDYVPQLGGYIKATETVTTPTQSETVTVLLNSIATP